MKISLLVVTSMLLVVTAAIRADAPATQPAAALSVDEAMMAKVPVVLRVKWKEISPPGGNPSDTVEVMQVIKNDSDQTWGKVARIDHEPGKEGVPHHQPCTVYLEISEKLRGRPWALLGGGAKTGISHIGSIATTQPFDQAVAAKLVGQLGDTDFTVREAATLKLIGMGDAVRPVLDEKGKEKNLDPEAAARIQRVIAELDLDPKHWPVIKGTVVDKQGSPVANARVYCPDDEDAAVTTNADGTFVMRLPPGAACERVVAKDGRLVAVAKGPFKPKADEARDVGVLKLGPVFKQ